MFIDQAETPEQFWAALISTSLKKGYGGALIPTSDLKENLAINIATQLNMSLLVKDGKYVFSSYKDGSLVQLGSKITFH